MDKKAWLIFSVIVVAILGGMILLSMQKKADINDLADDKIIGAINAEKRNGNIADHTFGNQNAKVVVIEYADYQCSGCGTASPKMKDLAEKYKDNVLLIFRNFPLANSHPNARAASAVAEAAGLQGKFWEMHQLLFKNQREWSSASATDRDKIFQSYAQGLGLDVDKFKTDIASEAVKNKIDFDLALGHKQKVSATPSFYINGKATEMDSDGSIEKSLKEALKEAGIPTKE